MGKGENDLTGQGERGRGEGAREIKLGGREMVVDEKKRKVGRLKAAREEGEDKRTQRMVEGGKIQRRVII